MTLWLPLALFELWTSFKIITNTCDCISAGSLFATENKKQFRLTNADFWLNENHNWTKAFHTQIHSIDKPF